MADSKPKAFTIAELLTVISTTSVLMAISVPALVTARVGAQKMVCRSNLRQLVLANIEYSDEHDGFFVAAASDMMNSSTGGYHRWQGIRSDENAPFDPYQGPLASYLGSGGKVKECPSKVRYTRGQKWEESFEKGCGGYGYNMSYIGSSLWRSGLGLEERCSQTTNITSVSKPAETLMFADTGFNKKGRLIEYSFAEPPYSISDGKLSKRANALPSIHFRHKGTTNVGWVDGHCDSRQKADCKGLKSYNRNFDAMNLGWFEPLDNTLFDLD